MQALVPVRRLSAVAFSAIVSLSLAFATPASAGYDEGAAAFIRGDYEVAWKEWLTLGERGHQSAQYNLGVLYSIGLGVDQDDVEASKWFRRAADRGLPAAQMRLGTAYLEGKGVPEDLKEAYFWFTLAATHFSLGEQHEQAVAARESTGAGLSRAQITSVLERAMGWKPLAQSVDKSEKERLIAEPNGDGGLVTKVSESNGFGAESGEGPASKLDAAQADVSEVAESSEIAAATPELAPAETEQAAANGEAQNGHQNGHDAEQQTAEAGDSEGETAGLDLPLEVATAVGAAHESQSPAAPEAGHQAAQRTFAAHLSSVRSASGAESEWLNLQGLYPGLLDGQELAVTTIEVEDQGTFYRVMAGPIGDFDEAQDLCDRLEASDQYCVVRRLGGSSQ